jgi:hypothetical protein
MYRIIKCTGYKSEWYEIQKRFLFFFWNDITECIGAKTFDSIESTREFIEIKEFKTKEKIIEYV